MDFPQNLYKLRFLLFFLYKTKGNGFEAFRKHFQIDFFVSTVSAGYTGYEVYIL